MFGIATILYIILTPAVYNFLWKAIQEGEMFGKWQLVVEWVWAKGYKKLSDFIGGCQVCFAHFIAWLGYVLWSVLCYEHLEWLVFVLWLGVVPFIWYLNLISKLALDVLAEKAEKLKRENEQH
jgi:hypothetical protein